MKIGLTYDLRADYLAAGHSEEETAEFDRPDTIEGIEDALVRLGHQTDRIGHGRALVARLAAGDRWDLVFNIAEGLFGQAREAQVPCLLDLYQVPYTFSDPLVLAVCLDKGLTKLLVRQAGVPTPDFAVVHSPAEIEQVHLPFPVFVKPVAEGTGKGITAASEVHDPAALRRACQQVLEQCRQPALVERFLSGDEFTVGILGTGPAARVVGAMQVCFDAQRTNVYSYATKRDYEGLVEYTLARGPVADRLAELALAAWRALGCCDGGRMDFRCGADGQPQFLEVNPLAGLNPVHSDLPILCRLAGMEYPELIAQIVASATERCPAAAAACTPLSRPRERGRG